jgi:hypothetical protein
METFFADVRMRLEAESIEAAGGALRRLEELARDAGFELREGKVVPAPSDGPDTEGWTGYAPSNGCGRT